MKKVLTTVALSLSALMATSAAMAAPGLGHDHRMDPRKAPPPAHSIKHADKSKHQNKHWNDSRAQAGHKQVNPKRDWRVGQTLPAAYDSKRFEVSRQDARGLAQPAKNQQWLKINGDYVLINEKTNKVVRIIG